MAFEVHKRRREAWLKENREAIEAYNEFVAQQGVFGTEVENISGLVPSDVDVEALYHKHMMSKHR